MNSLDIHHRTCGSFSQTSETFIEEKASVGVGGSKLEAVNPQIIVVIHVGLYRLLVAIIVGL